MIGSSLVNSRELTTPDFFELIRLISDGNFILAVPTDVIEFAPALERSVVLALAITVRVVPDGAIPSLVEPISFAGSNVCEEM